jgi:hypothetical protein
MPPAKLAPAPIPNASGFAAAMLTPFLYLRFQGQICDVHGDVR